MDLGIRGKTAIVCAASRGLGRAIAIALAREGVNLVRTSPLRPIRQEVRQLRRKHARSARSRHDGSAIPTSSAQPARSFAACMLVILPDKTLCSMAAAFPDWFD